MNGLFWGCVARALDISNRVVHLMKPGPFNFFECGMSDLCLPSYYEIVEVKEPLTLAKPKKREAAA
jgi:hypothetical protein